MKKEVTFKNSWKHQIIALSLLFASGGLFAQNHNCNANFQFQQLNSTDTVNFHSATNPVGTYYSWTFGDGGTSTLVNPSHTYASPGTYYVCLGVIDSTLNNVCTDNHCDSVYVQGPPPPPPPPMCNAHFTAQVNPNNGSACFHASQNANGSDYSWNFGDGNTSTQPNPCHTYASTGSYVVCLTVVDTTNSGNCSDNQCDTVTIGAPPAPTCNAHFNHNSFNGSINFVPAQNAPGTYYAWTFGDGGTSSVPAPHHTYASPGTYYVCLTVNDTNVSGNCSDTWCDSVHVGHNPPPPPPPHHFGCNANFRYSTILATDTVNFQSALNSPITTYFWDFGDGTTSTSANPVHVFADTITYFVCLTVKDSDSTGVLCSHTWCDSVLVGDRSHCGPPHPRIDASITSPTAVIYPNPFSETATLHIENTSGIVTFRVFELSGRLAFTKQFSNGDFQLDRSNLGAGMYFYDITDANNSVIKGKLIIQ